MSKTNTITILPNGTKISDLKSQAKKLKKDEGLKHAEALQAIAEQNGYESWDSLAGSSWMLVDHGDLISDSAFKHGGKSFAVVMPLMEEWEAWLDEDDVEREMSIVAHLVTGEGTPYLEMHIEYSNLAVDFEVPDGLRQQLGAALGGPLVDRVRAQVALAEHVLGWIDYSQVTATFKDRCEMERHLRGITEDDLVWEAPGLAGYDANVWSVRVYDGGEAGIMVFYQPNDVGHETEIWGTITQEQFEDLSYDPADYQATMFELMDVAGLSED